METEKGVPMGGADQWLSDNTAHLSQEEATPTKTSEDNASPPNLTPTTKDTHRQITLSTKATKPSKGLVSGLFNMFRSHALLQVSEGVGQSDLNEEADMAFDDDDAPLDESNLLQTEATRPPPPRNPMRDAILRIVSDEETSLLQTAKVAVSDLAPSEDPHRGMTEADESIEVPEGGFPVPDYN